MPGRQSHGGPPPKQPKIRVNNKKRSLNAFAIAVQQYPEKAKIRQHRLGESEGGKRPGKRARKEGDKGDDENASNTKKPRKTAVKGRFDELDIDTGSDSEGNEWRMGQVDSDDDSDLDSDEAFGESDEEKFQGFAFSGSSNKNKAKRGGIGTGSRDITLDEVEDGSEILFGSNDDDLGDEAIDLAAMLDATEDSHAEETKVSTEGNHEENNGSSNEDSDTESADSDRNSSLSFMEDNDESNPDKIAALQNLITNFPQTDLSKSLAQQRSDRTSEYNTPSDFGVIPKAKLTLEDLGLLSVKDPFVKKSLKLLASESKGDVKRSGISGKLAVPLAKRHQDRLDRSAAYEKSKETLNRWTDTVKHNRRAEHLIFPLPDPDFASANSNTRLQPTTNSKPFNELEATIQGILEESGLAAANGGDDEDKLMEFEELEMNKMSIEEVKARRDQLRMARDLLFHEEARAKRIKKIKSKSYRKVHRKRREKENRLNRQALIDAGINPSEDEQEIQDRRRAEERMGAKHRESKWAKSTRQTGRAAWDEDARIGITEMAKRDEELRQRVEGRTSRKDGAEESESSISESEEDNVEEGGTQTRMLRKLEGAGGSDVFTDSGPGSKLSNMKFMLKAEASRKKENDEVVDQMRKELAGEDSSDDDAELPSDVGRRAFGPGRRQEKENSSMAQKSSEFEEVNGSDDDAMVDITIASQGRELPVGTVLPKNGRHPKSSQRSAQQGMTRLNPAISNTLRENLEGGAWSRTISQKDSEGGSEARRRKQKLNTGADVEELDLSKAAVIEKQAKPKTKPNVTQSILLVADSDDEGSEADIRLPFAIRDQELIKRAFAGADVVGEFEAEKRQTIEDEDEKIIDNTLPGWGSWVGEGISKKDKRQNKGRFLTKTEGIKEQNRKDAKLERVIINEKRVKKNVKYLASSLPHPFETRQQYERSLRLPVGPEWSTKETFQDATKPRILMKQGIISPMSKPLL